MKYLDVLLVLCAGEKPRLHNFDIAYSEKIWLAVEGVDLVPVDPPAWDGAFIFFDWLRTVDGGISGVRLFFSDQIPMELAGLIPAKYRKIKGNALSILFSIDDFPHSESNDQILTGGNRFFSRKNSKKELLALSLLLPS